MPEQGCCASGDCPAAQAISLVASELKLVVLHGLMAQGRRFNELKDLTKLCQSSLARTLKELEEYGLAERVVRAEERPVAVEYRLTAMGKDLTVAIEAFERWADHWWPDLEARAGKVIA